METKAGHAPMSQCPSVTETEPPCDGPFPAKAGGKHPSSGEHWNQERDQDPKEWECGSSPKQTLIISGAITRGDKDFPPAAVQVAHQKPQPCLEKFDAMLWGNQHIHQPCK
ncbi:death-associated protein 1-like isoform X2 [Terrapene carolina triunguis]|uniref:death-associated protein 1-like isoform X2 n=1 Tax=Terrapene triunguis TaxID=2587831 RepID=UPI000E77DE72|nr:death-associated protein 1-like isoform X2 [Terrapene carolina triunguis]